MNTELINKIDANCGIDSLLSTLEFYLTVIPDNEKSAIENCIVYYSNVYYFNLDPTDYFYNYPQLIRSNLKYICYLNAIYNCPVLSFMIATVELQLKHSRLIKLTA